MKSGIVKLLGVPRQSRGFTIFAIADIWSTQAGSACFSDTVAGVRSLGPMCGWTKNNIADLLSGVVAL